MGYKTKIDWCDSSWNPVTGCMHDCGYCYARTLAKRYGGFDHDENKKLVGTQLAIGVQELDRPKHIMRRNGMHKAPYPWGFLPTLHRYRLDQPQKWSEPRTIFVCSMADLFGKWVPDEWIEDVFKACEAAPQHRYLFLTKNPRRYHTLAQEGKLPNSDNFWYGSTAETEDKTVWFADSYNTFISIEPIHGRFDCTETPEDFTDWIIVGAETGNRAGMVVPKREWVEELVEYGKRSNVPVFMKESLRGLMGDDFKQEFPWEVKSNENPV